jgi:hypothetical protein
MNDNSVSAKQKLIVVGAVLAIIGSAIWIYQTEFAQPVFNAELHRAVGQIMAEETSRILGHNAKLVIVAMETRHAPELKLQIDSFEKHLKLLGGITVKNRLMLDPGDNPKFRPGSGLSEKRFLKLARKNSGVDAIVSFVGMPEVSDAGLANLKSIPKVIAETHSPERLINLLNKKILNVAIVPRFEFPAPGPRTPETSQQWFDHYFQIVTAETPLAKPDGSP